MGRTQSVDRLIAEVPIEERTANDYVYAIAGQHPGLSPREVLRRAMHLAAYDEARGEYVASRRATTVAKLSIAQQLEQVTLGDLLRIAASKADSLEIK